MNVRDLRQYVINKCGEDTLHLLGSSKERLLQTMDGQSNTEGHVESIIASIASFASNAEEQLFYEFVQNAYDANADSLFFYANRDFLIVLNNGEPFYTDFNKENYRDGQLYNFLTKGKSLKRNDAAKLGKYGQGSKLLYTLLTDVTDFKENEEALIETIIGQKKGPYLISWYNRNQLANLLQEQGDWHHAQADDYQNNILFAKILMSYYPIAPGTSEELFSNQEALTAIKVFDKLVNPRRNLHYLNRGTALIVPLGKGKYERITSPSNLENVRTRLGGFASITKNQERNAGKTVQHIYVMGEEIEQHEAQSVFVKFEVERNAFEYHFAFNPVFAERNYVNLFKVLPILETKFQLGFIVDCQKFDVDDSRQRIVDKEKTKNQLIRAFTELVKRLREIKVSDPKKFDYIYKAIIASKSVAGDDFKFIRDAFQAVLIPFLREFVLCDTGEYAPELEVRKPADDLNISLSALGITKYKWIDQSIKTDLNRLKIYPKEIDFPALLQDADSGKLAQWILTLSDETYAHFFEMADTNKYHTAVIGLRLFRSNRGNLYSFEELKSTSNIYFAIEANIPFGDCERIVEILSDIDRKNYLEELFKKIKANIDYFQSSDSAKEDAANLLAWIQQQDAAFVGRIRSEIPLFQNWHDEYVPFKQLLLGRPEGSILFDNYTVKGFIPNAVRENGWLLDPQKEQKECWHWVVKNWDAIKEREQWGENTHQYIADVTAAYNAVPVEPSLFFNKNKLTLYLNEEGLPIDDQQYLINNVSRLTAVDYAYLREKLPNWGLTPYAYIQDLKEGPFSINSIHILNIVGDGIEVDERLLKIIIALSDNFLSHCRTEVSSGKFLITKLYGGLNYSNSVSKELEQELEAAHIYHIPELVQEWLEVESSRYLLNQNEDLLAKAIQRVEHPLMLLPYAKGASDTVLECLFKRNQVIEIDSKLTPEDYKWQLIELAVKRDSPEHRYKDVVFSAIQHESKSLPLSIIDEFTFVGDHKYSVYELKEDYKEDNQSIDSFFACLPSEDAVAYFKEHYYNGKKDTISAIELFNYLRREYLSIAQLRFCLDYALTNKDSCRDLELDEQESLTEALDMILQNNFVGFNRHLLIKGLDLNIQAYADRELLSDNEQMPNIIHHWLDQHPEGVKLFSHLITEQDPFLVTRKSLLNDLPCADLSDFFDGNNELEINRTLGWAQSKQLTYAYDSNRFKTMMTLIKTLPHDYKPLPLLRYTGKVALDRGDKDSPIPTFTLEFYQKGAAFLSWKNWNGGQFQRRLASSRSLSQFFEQQTVFVYDDEDLFLDHMLDHTHRWNVLTSADLYGYPEYDDPVYQTWKASTQSAGITLYTSRSSINMSFCIREGEYTVFSDKMRNSVCGFDEISKRVIIQQPNPEGLSVMKTLAKYIGSMHFFKEPFIALQSLYVDQLELIQQAAKQADESDGKSLIDLSNSTLSEEQVQETVNKISAETAEHIEQVNVITQQMNTEELSKLTDLAEPIKQLIGKLDEESIERIAKDKDKILDMLEEQDIADQDEKESKVRQIIGFIGELIYGYYLEHKHLVRDRDFVHAALKGVGEYDFEIKTEHLFVDVKTTLYSLKDGTAPFYLHRSQNQFMQKHPDSKYHIVRISLLDLNLKSSYEDLRAIYGVHANPLENDMLREDCEALAKKYWRGVRIEEFDALAPEYVIRIEQK